MIKLFAYYLGVFSHYLLPMRLKVLCHAFMDNINTGYLSKCFYAIGKSVKIESGVFVSGMKFISIGDGTIIEKNSIITAEETIVDSLCKIKIGKNVSIRRGVHITSSNFIEIGDNVLISPNVLITDNSHGNLLDKMDVMLPPLKRKVFSKGSVIIDSNVWIGEGACILPNVHIGTGAIIGAHSTVTCDVSPYACLVGCPSRKIIK